MISLLLRLTAFISGFRKGIFYKYIELLIHFYFEKISSPVLSYHKHLSYHIIVYLVSLIVCVIDILNKAYTKERIIDISIRPHFFTNRPATWGRNLRVKLELPVTFATMSTKIYLRNSLLSMSPPISTSMLIQVQHHLPSGLLHVLS